MEVLNDSSIEQPTWLCVRSCRCWFCICCHDVHCWVSKNRSFLYRMWQYFFLIFFSLTQVFLPIMLLVLSQKKLAERNSLTTKERPKSEKNNTWNVSLCLLFSPSVVAVVKWVKVKLGRTYIRMNRRKRLLLWLLPRCVNLLLYDCYIKIKYVSLSCWFWIYYVLDTRTIQGSPKVT